MVGRSPGTLGCTRDRTNVAAVGGGVQAVASGVANAAEVEVEKPEAEEESSTVEARGWGETEMSGGDGR